MRKSLFIGLLALSSTMIFAQNQEQRIKEPEKITFKPHWFIQAQIGAAHTCSATSSPANAARSKAMGLQSTMALSMPWLA